MSRLNSPQHKISLFVLLFILTSSIFFSTYSGRIESGDTLSLFNAVGSLAQYNDLLLDRSAWQNMSSPINYGNGLPLNPIDVEPLQIAVSLIPYTIAKYLPNVGLVHVVWTLNIVICSLIVSVFFLYAVALGYSEQTAVFAATLLGIATIIWPYSKSYFREPLACLTLLLTAYFIERWTSNHYRIGWPLIGAVVSIGGSLLAKDATILVAPALLVLSLPSLRPLQNPLVQKFIKAIAAFLLVIFAIFVVVSVLQSPLNIDLDPVYQGLIYVFYRRASVLNTAHVALHSYLLSVGGSVWGTSPVGLLAIPGIWMLYRKRQYRYPAVIIIAVLGIATGYAYLRGSHWFGGLSWPPRFLIPVVPFLLIGSLPVLDRFLTRAIPACARWLIGILILYSLWIQLSGVSLDWGAYNAALPPEANGLGEWGGGLNVVAYLRWVVIPTLWGRVPLDFAWVRNGVAAWPLACSLIAVLSGVMLWRIPHPPRIDTAKFRMWIPAALSAMLLLTVYFCLRSIFRDSLYSGDQQSLHDIIPIIQEHARSGDILILPDNNYMPFFLNYGKFAWPRIITLPDQPGERSSPDQPPLVTSDYPDALLDKDTLPLLMNLAQNRQSLWVLADSGPWITWSVRPVERFMAAHYFPIQEFSTDSTVRLIQYSTAAAPDPLAFRGPDYTTDLRYGQSIRLAGFSLPDDTDYKAGNMLDLSLYWEAENRVEENYTVAWFVVDSSGSVVAQGQDYQPGWGFMPTTAWQPGVPVRDNRALHLPDKLKPGIYRIWVRLYSLDNSNAVHNLAVTGTETRDGITGVLPAEIRIE
jgi:hypothetical protein